MEKNKNTQSEELHLDHTVEVESENEEFYAEPGFLGPLGPVCNCRC